MLNDASETKMTPPSSNHEKMFNLHLQQREETWIQIDLESKLLMNRKPFAFVIGSKR